MEPDAPDPSTPSPEVYPAVRQVHEIGNRTYVVADVEPLDVTGLRTIAVGTALFALGAVVLLMFLDRLRADDHVWWLWVCVAGFGLGLFGYWWCLRRARRLASRPAPDSADGSPDRSADAGAEVVQEPGRHPSA